MQITLVFAYQLTIFPQNSSLTVILKGIIAFHHIEAFKSLKQYAIFFVSGFLGPWLFSSSHSLLRNNLEGFIKEIRRMRGADPVSFVLCGNKEGWFVSWTTSPNGRRHGACKRIFGLSFLRDVSKVRHKRERSLYQLGSLLFESFETANQEKDKCMNSYFMSAQGKRAP